MQILNEIFNKIPFITPLDLRYYIGILSIIEIYLYFYVICIILVVIFNRKKLWNI